MILLAMGVYSSFIGSISSTVNSLRAVRGEKIKQQLPAANGLLVSLLAMIR